MLELLRIHNLALIEDLEMEFVSGINVLTGETGAGKSFILKALAFLTGEKLGVDMVRPGKEKAMVEALFLLDGEEVLLRRELLAETGRSRMYVNDHLCSQETVKELRPKLVLHTSQHGQQKLLQPSFQAAVLDEHMHRPELLQQRDRLVQEYLACANLLLSLEQTRQALEDKRDVLEFQQQEIEKVSPRADEEEELEARRTAIRNQAGIAENAAAALSLLDGGEDGAGLLSGLGRLERSISALSALLEEFAETPDLLMETRAQLEDLGRKLRKAISHASREEDLESVESRLYALAQLKRKLKRPLHSILSLQTEIKENLDFLDSCSLEKAKLAERQEQCLTALQTTLNELNTARKAAAQELSAALQDELKGLGFGEDIRVLFAFVPVVLCGDDARTTELRGKILWQPNPGQPPQPLDRIASGGELSRFLLALVSLMAKTMTERPTLIFDEVDAGVGGRTLQKVALSLDKLASSRQILLITHWPQLAVCAARHFVVQKEVVGGQTYTRCCRLEREEIAGELARMSGTEA